MDDARPDDATAITPELEAENVSLDAFTATTNPPPIGVDGTPVEILPARHRARKQRAGAADVPRIAELTRRLRETEAERDALKASPTPAAVPPVPSSAGPAASPAPVPRTAASVPPVTTADQDPEPEVEKYEDWTKWLREHSRWSAREELRAAQAAQTRATQADQQRSEAARLETQWKAGVTEAKAKYPDFEAVAFAPTRIPKNSLIDAWILEHKTGPSVLYHLQGHGSELDTLLALPLFDQVEALTLLSQRLAPTRTAAVTTGAAPAPGIHPVSRPPTPVRTGPMRPADEPPDPEQASLSDHTAYFGTPRSRRAHR